MRLALERSQAIEGIEQVLLSVAATQTAATGLYRSLGFQLYGLEPRALKIGDRFIDEEYFILHPINVRQAEKPRF
jgi:ribosomal protein S18 acetylase RimI-like enzyme